jgi:sigma-B regulation protein RsbU (phosphoserine phosphatase)
MVMTPAAPGPGSLERLLERALAAAGEGVVIADARLPDMPLIYVNDAFVAITGYRRDEVLGRNCRFLQGPGTSPAALAELRGAIAARRPVVVELLNYRRDGSPFWNRLSITPVHDDAGEVTHFIGVQSDVTARRQAEERLAAANRKIHRDLEVAARIQKNLLPDASVTVPGVEAAWAFRPCDELAGDMLNFLRLDDDTTALFVLDVSGHGVPAALLSFTLAHTLAAAPESSCLFARSPRGWTPASPSAVAAVLNRRFQLDPAVPQFFTLFYAVVDVPSGGVRYVSAGHPLAAVTSRSDAPRLLPATGPPIGIAEGALFAEGRIELAAGDRLIVFTDGLSEAVTPSGEELGVERVLEAAAGLGEQPLRACVEALADLGLRWAGGAPHDDISVAAVELASGGSPRSAGRRPAGTA